MRKSLLIHGYARSASKAAVFLFFFFFFFKDWELKHFANTPKVYGEAVILDGYVPIPLEVVKELFAPIIAANPKILEGEHRAWYRSNDETGEYDHLASSTEKLKKEILEGEYDFIVGHSQGALTVQLVVGSMIADGSIAKLKKPLRLILFGSPTNKPKAVELFEKWGFLDKKFDLSCAFLHGTADKMCSFEEVKDWIPKYFSNAKIVAVDNGRHFPQKENEEQYKEIDSWAESQFDDNSNL